jgi:hypothetical protein
MLASMQAARAAAARDRSDAFALPGPYELCGPVPSKTKPDVWAVYKAATAARYEVEFCPGLVLRLGQGTVFMSYFVTFHGKHHHRFNEASSADMLFTSLPEFLDWLAAHPHPKSPYLR